VSLLSGDGREILIFQYVPKDSRIEIKIPERLSGMYLLRIAMNSGNEVTRKIIIR
jgi:hypothetical protein